MQSFPLQQTFKRDTPFFKNSSEVRQIPLNQLTRISPFTKDENYCNRQDLQLTQACLDISNFN